MLNKLYYGDNLTILRNMDDECVVEVGKLVGVEQMIAGTMGKIGSIYTISDRMIDVQTGKILSQQSLDCPCPIETLLTESMAQIAAVLSGTASITMPLPQPRPSPSERPRVKFIPYDDPPVPIGGYGAIQRNIVYPEIDQEAGIEGKVVIQAFVNEKGRVTDTVVLKGIPNSGLNEAAIDAIKKTRFNPARHGNRDVGVWISIPINFRLK